MQISNGITLVASFLFSFNIYSVDVTTKAFECLLNKYSTDKDIGRISLLKLEVKPKYTSCTNILLVSYHIFS